MASSEITHREHEILDLISAGCGSKEIARGLGCSALTVETHISHVRMKLGARTRAEAVAIWSRRRQEIEARIFGDTEYPKSTTEKQVRDFGD